MRMVDCVRSSNWEMLEGLAPSLHDTWRRRQSVGASPLALHWGLRKIRHLRTTWRRRGLSVALLGPDGAGKSSLATQLQSSFIFPVRCVYMGLTGGRLPQVARLRVLALVTPGRLLVFWCR